MDVYGLIIAGGVGARFWPRSRERSPKQLLEIIGRGTMIQNTVYRLDPIIPQDRIYIVTNALQAEEIKKQLPQIPQENILMEPAGRNTAPAISFAAEVLRKRVGDAVMVVLPADHLIHDIEAFQETLRNAIQVAVDSKGLVTIGIKPTHPETGYGYIQLNNDEAATPYHAVGAYPVVTFAEKPSLETAKRFLESGDFVWNSGMFIFKVSSILNSIAEYLPEISEEFHALRAHIDTAGFPRFLEKAYREMHSISIDYGVMEKASNRFVIPSEFGWNDLGSWDEVYRILPKDEAGNAFHGDLYLRESKNCHVFSGGNRFIAMIGLENVTVIDTKDALLVCKRGDSQKVKEVVDYLRKKGGTQYL
jgi:mannose-1-phosphate guanylyltransferase